MNQTRNIGRLWSNPHFRGGVIQFVIVAGVLISLGTIVSNTASNLSKQGIASGFDFLNSTSGFAIVQTLIPYDEASTYGRVFWVGLINTLAVSGLGVFFATIIGFGMGIARLSNNWLLAKIASVYVETLRNIPLLLQIFFWYFITLHSLPHPRQSFSLGSAVFLNNRGLYLPGYTTSPNAGFVYLAIATAVALIIWIYRRSASTRVTTGKETPTRIPVLAAMALPAVVFLTVGRPFHLDLPFLSGFNFEGGFVLIPELVSLVVALSLYTGTFIAEIVRSGIMAVNQGQVEAASSLGLPPRLVMRLVVVPQALRIIIPPLTSQFLNLTKNSSLAAAIGYPDLVAVFAGTVLNQTGQAVEVIAITMSVYLALSLGISIVMNWYNHHIALTER